jgi:hypothetical protein
MLLNDNPDVPSLDDCMDRAGRRGPVRRMIPVMPTASLRYGGSSTSTPATGRATSHVIEELVPFVDRTYRIGLRAPRGGVGKSWRLWRVGDGVMHPRSSARWALQRPLLDYRSVTCPSSAGGSGPAGWRAGSRRSIRSEEARGSTALNIPALAAATADPRPRPTASIRRDRNRRVSRRRVAALAPVDLLRMLEHWRWALPTLRP